ncbi:MAG TPA: hypothetical protein V6C58_16485, partial [Allocoleopsis sp.]
DSKNNTNSGIDYLVLSLEEKEYVKLSSKEKNNLIKKVHLDILDNCNKCNIDLDMYKRIYSVMNTEIYEKKKISPEKRHTECFYIYTQCRLCDDTKRVGDRIYYEDIILEKQGIFHKIYKWLLG